MKPLPSQSFMFFDNSAHILPVSRALLSLTYRCNFKCIHCLQGEDKKRGTYEELSTKEWVNIIKQLSEYGLSMLLFTGGEPLLRKDAPELLRVAADYAFPFRIYTNGLLVNDRLVNTLKSLDTLIVQISLQGINPATCDTFVGYLGAFDKVTHSIRLLSSAGIRVAVATSLRDELIPYMEDFPILLEELGAVQWIPSLIMPLGCAYENWAKLRLSDSNMPIFIDTLLRLISMYKNSELRISGPLDISALQGNEATWKECVLSFGCDMYGHYINIEPDGTITPCDRMTNYKLGSLKNESFKQIMQKKEVIQTQKNEVNTRLKFIGALDRCNACSYRNLCGMGCPRVTLKSKSLGEEYNDPVVCRTFHECFDVILKYCTSFPRKQLLKEVEKI